MATKKTTKIISILLILIMSITIGAFPVFAHGAIELEYPLGTEMAQSESCESSSEKEETIPQYQTVCGSLPYHQMYPYWICTCYKNDGTLYISQANLWQCKNCYTLLATEGEAGGGGSILKWGSSSYGYPLDYVPVTVMYCSNWG